MEPTVAVNDTLDEFAGTVTEAGVLRLALLSDRATTAPPLGALPVKVTVQLVEPGALITVELQLNVFRVTCVCCATVIVPPVPVSVRSEERRVGKECRSR